MCPALYDGAIPRDLGHAITRLDLDCCGDLIFVRMPSDTATETLSEFLAEGYPILKEMSRQKQPATRFKLKIAANWKFSHHISLDDYHVVAVHPTTFGKNGYIKPERVKYYRFGRHSSFIATERDDCWEEMQRLCVSHTYKPHQYVILNIFPNTVISLANATNLFGAGNWYVTITRYVAVSETKSEAHVWMFKAPFETDETRISRFSRFTTDKLLLPIAVYYARKIMNEDNVICEGQQRLAHQVSAEQNLSAYEQRIGWFEEAYRAALEADS